MIETREQYRERTGAWPGFPMDYFSEEAFAAMQRAAEFGSHGHTQEPKPGERFGEARRKLAAMDENQRIGRRFGRNRPGFTPGGV